LKISITFWLGIDGGICKVEGELARVIEEVLGSGTQPRCISECREGEI
jgi:hypothetical protein